MRPVPLATAAVAVAAFTGTPVFAAPPVAPPDLRAEVYSATAAELFWSRSTDPDGIVRGYEVRRDGQLVDASDGLSHFTDSLTEGRTFDFTVTAVDFDGERSAPASISVVAGDRSGAIGSTDDRPPPPANLTARVYSSSAAEVFWDRVSGTRLSYEVSLDDEVVATTGGTSHFAGGVPGLEGTRIEVVAIDAQGRRSDASAVTLPAYGNGSTAPPSNGPAAPAGLSARVYSFTAAEITWTRSTTPGLVHEVRRVDESGETVATTDGNSYYDDTLLPGREYRYKVVAIDRAGRRSEVSAVTLATGGSAAPDGPEALRATRYSGSDGEIFWERSTEGSRRYEIGRDGEALATVDGTSFYDGTLEAGRSYRYEVVAIDPLGRRSEAAAVTLGNTGVLAIADIERLTEHLFDVINGTDYRSVLSRLNQVPGFFFVDELAPVPGGGPIRTNCPEGGTATAESVADPAAQTSARYAFDGCNLRRSVFGGGLTFTRGTFDGPDPTVPRTPGENELRLSEARGPLTVTRSSGAIAWQGDIRLLLFADGGAAFELDFDALDYSLGGAALTLADVDTDIVCTTEIPLRIDSRLAFSSPLTAGRTLEVRVPDTLRVIDVGDGTLGLTGRVVATADDGSRLELDWRDGDGSSYRASIENGALGGERTLPTAPLLRNIFDDLSTLLCPARERL